VQNDESNNSYFPSVTDRGEKKHTTGQNEIVLSDVRLITWISKQWDTRLWTDGFIWLRTGTSGVLLALVDSSFMFSLARS